MSTEKNIKMEDYAEIVSQYQKRQQKIQGAEERSEFLLSLADMIGAMSPQIYEHYRALCDLFVSEMKQQLTEKADQMTARAILKACDLGIVLKEKYEPLGRKMLLEAQQGGPQDVSVPEKAESTGENGIAQVLLTTARSAVLSLKDGGIYYTKEVYRVLVNGVFVKDTDTVITSVYDLYPQTDYVLEIQKENGECVGKAVIRTGYESVTINVKEFGAAGDGIQDDTKFIQAAILSCPKQGRVLIPQGTYRITSLFLKSHISVEVGRGAELKADPDREQYVRYPARLISTDETDEIHLGTWEGNPLPMFAGIISGFEVEDVLLYGEGTIDGNASKQDWWKDPKIMRTAFRPRLFFINHCEHITLQGLKFCNSPSWTLHPFFSNHLKFYNVTIENPADSPNTDGLDPESCDQIEIAGVRFSLGDDCIAVKSGKLYMGKKYKTPSQNIHIWQCLMENGHGAVTIGSEMAGGVNNLVVEDCRFSHTDRGLRVKTRRGRGEDAILDEIVFRNIDMDHVMTPFVVNSFYFCDPDGHSAYVQSREYMPVDERTPKIRRLVFSKIRGKNCHVAAAHLEGLPEQKIEEIVLDDIQLDYAEDAKCDVPAMSEGVESCSKKGIFVSNVKKLIMKDVCISGAVGDEITLCNVDTVIRDDQQM